MAYLMYIDDVLFPITPGKVTMKVKGKNKAITLIHEGEVNLMKSPGLTEISIDKLLLPALQNYPFANCENVYGGSAAFHNASYYLDCLEAWKTNRSPVKWKMIRMSPDGCTLLWDSSMDVTIEKYDIVEDASNQGLDVMVKLEMKQYVYFAAKKLVVKKKKKSKKKSKKTKMVCKKVRAKKKNPAKSYTVLENDCMQSIAKKQLGNGARWMEIYDLNKNDMDLRARLEGHRSALEGLECRVYPGEVLKLPT